MPAPTTPLTLVLVIAVWLTLSTSSGGVVVVVGFAPPPTFSDRGRLLPLPPRTGGEGSTTTTSPFRIPAGTLGYSTSRHGTGTDADDEFNGRPSPDHVSTSVGVGGDDDDDASSATTSAMSTNHLMHAMIRVRSVNETVNYWRDRWGANVNHYRRTKRAETAFVGFGDGSPNDGFFSLEITSLPPGEEPVLGDAVVYLGLSMLLDFDFDLRSAAAGEKGRRTSGERDVGAVEPNGLEVRSVASGPGDPLARLCLRTTPDKLAETAEFYTDVLGMEQVAVDGRCVCLRYTHDGGGGGSLGEDEGGGAERKRRGVPTTLVFAVDEELGEREVDHGNCFDHVALSTADVEAANDAIRSRVDAESIYMEPTPMFGTVVMGVKDPNGYKMVLVQRKG